LEVEFAVDVEAPPVAVESAVLVAAPPAPAVFELEFEPAPPAPPVTLTVFVDVAELVCDSVLDCVLVFPPELVADALLLWLVLPCVVSPTSPKAPATNARAAIATIIVRAVRSLLT
jgi:hypothetical protein